MECKHKYSGNVTDTFDLLMKRFVVLYQSLTYTW